MRKQLYILTIWSSILLSSLLTNCDGCKTREGDQANTPQKLSFTAIAPIRDEMITSARDGSGDFLANKLEYLKKSKEGRYQ